MSENTICVVEDIKPIRKLLCTVLEKAGFSTVDFPDGRTSIEWLESNKPIGVIADILLPDINGTEILDYIRKRSDESEITVVAVTGFAQQSDRDKYLGLGFDGYFAKPINTSTFAADISKIIETKNKK